MRAAEICAKFALTFHDDGTFLGAKRRPLYDYFVCSPCIHTSIIAVSSLSCLLLLGALSYSWWFEIYCLLFKSNIFLFLFGSFCTKFNRKINNFKQNFLRIRQIPLRTIMIDGSNKALKSIRYYLNLFPFSPASPPGNSSAKFVLNKFYALLGSSPSRHPLAPSLSPPSLPSPFLWAKCVICKHIM